MASWHENRSSSLLSSSSSSSSSSLLSQRLNQSESYALTNQNSQIQRRRRRKASSRSRIYVAGDTTNSMPSRENPEFFSSSKGSSGTAINAAALQQHFMRSVSLAVPNFALQGSRNFVKANARTAGRHRRRRSSSSSSTTATRSATGENRTGSVQNLSVAVHGSLSSVQRELHHATRPWTCQHCTCLNRARYELCSACGQQRDRSPFALESDRDSRADSTAQLRQQGEQEHVLHNTLAQQRGLVPPPPAPLTAAEWQEAEWNHECRDAQRGMAETDCAICMERLGSSEQVILSCSHVYHATCLRNFEKFTRRIDRSCPLCRKANYQKKKYSPAQALMRKRSATKIQARFREYWARKTYRKILQQHYSSGRGDRDRAHIFFAAKVTAVSEKLVNAMNRKANEVDQLLNEGDHALALSRSIFSTMGDLIPAAGQNPNNSGLNDSLQENGDPHSKSNVTCSMLSSDFDWMEVRKKAEDRGITDCPICMSNLNTSQVSLIEEERTREHQSPNRQRHVSLLSCTHVFHEACIEAFERFAFSNNEEPNQTSKRPVIFTCPVCRAGYHRRRLGEIVLLADATIVSEDATIETESRFAEPQHEIDS